MRIQVYIYIDMSNGLNLLYPRKDVTEMVIVFCVSPIVPEVLAGAHYTQHPMGPFSVKNPTASPLLRRTRRSPSLNFDGETPPATRKSFISDETNDMSIYLQNYNVIVIYCLCLYCVFFFVCFFLGGGFGVGEGCLDGVFAFKEILIAKKGWYDERWWK